MVGAAETPYDLRFRLLGIPVRVHPLFWLVSAVLGWQSQDLGAVALWVACVFVSILVHEYGHGLVAKHYHGSPSILLWGMGGLCYSHADRQSPLQRLAVILAGPGAGFALLAAMLLLTSLFFRVTPGEHWDATLSLVGLAHFPDSLGLKFAFGMRSFNGLRFVLYTYFNLLQINLMWGLINLLPLWPLDGGQATQILLSFVDRSRGVRWGHIISLLVAGGLAIVVFTLSRDRDLFRTLFFAYFAIINYQVLQSLHDTHSTGLYQEDDWWRR